MVENERATEKNNGILNYPWSEEEIEAWRKLLRDDPPHFPWWKKILRKKF